MLNFKNVKQVISQLEQLNLEKVEVAEIRSLLSKLQGHITVSTTLNEGKPIGRSLIFENEEIPIEVDRVSYNKNPGKIFGRATCQGTAAFYGCLATEVIENYHNTPLEILPMRKDKIERFHFVTGKWILQNNSSFPFLGGQLDHLCDAGKFRHQYFSEYIKNQDNSDCFMLIDNFLCKEFSKEVPEEEPWKYKISATYAEMLKDEGLPGLIFPSVASNGAGLNIVIFPEAVDSGLIKLERAIYGTFYNRYGSYINDFVLEALAVGNKLRWKEVYKSMPPNVKAYYIGNSDDDSFKKQVIFKDLDIKI